MTPYVSHAVRRIRDEPIEGKPVTLRVTAVDEAAVDGIVDALADLGTVDARLRFAAVTATVPQEAVGAVPDLPGVETVETANALAMDADGAGEDVEPGQ